MKWRYYKAVKGMFKGNIFRKKRTVWWGYDRDLKEWVRMYLPNRYLFMCPDLLITI